jgi:hypothetical protein
MHHVMPSRGAKSIVRAGLCLPVVICGLALRLLGPGLASRSLS